MFKLNKIFKTNSDNKKNPFTVQEGKFRFGQLKDSYFYTGWTEHAFLPDGENKEVVGQTFDFKQLKIIKIVLFIFFTILLTRIIWLQLFQFDYYYSLAEINRSRHEIVEANRGIFYDKNGQALVRNVANFVLSIRLIDLPKDELERDEIVRDISIILDNQEENEINDNSFIISEGPSFSLIKEALSKVRYGSIESYQPIFIKDNIDYNLALKLILESNNLPGVIVSNKIRREYIQVASNNAYSLSHVLGYTGKISEQELVELKENYSSIDYLGKTGLEKTWEEELRGEMGSNYFEIDALGRRGKLINEIAPKDGYNLNLSLDLNLQIKIEEILKKYLDQLGLERAAVIVLDPNNGEILSLVSWPAYDNNKFAVGISYNDYQEVLNNPNRPLFNRAIGGEFPAGSTIKPLIAAMALEENIISENTSFLSTGGIRIGQWFFPDWLAGGHGRVDVRRAIAESVNTFFYYIGGGYQDFVGLGLDNLVKYSKLFGLGQASGIDLNGEAKGLVPSKEWRKEVKNEPWYIGNTYHFSIGQGDVLVTPLQIVNAISSIANGGKLYRPHFVREVVDYNGQIIKEIPKEIINQNFIDDYNLLVIRQAMRQTITSGSARRLNYLPVEVAGKTGTAQWFSQKDPHAWFTGFAPYNDPEIAFVILVEEGKEGSDASVSIAEEILNWYFSDK
jgi:penicillin-binding protein 2